MTTSHPSWDSTTAALLSMFIIQFRRSLFVIISPFRP
nr:MAG TPA: Protein of unknown function (DUF2811) [Caudoviricetes sp.]